MRFMHKSFLLIFTFLLMISGAAVSAAENATLGEDVAIVQSEALHLIDDMKYSPSHENRFDDGNYNSLDEADKSGLDDSSKKAHGGEDSTPDQVEMNNSNLTSVNQSSKTPTLDVAAQVNGFDVDVIVMCTGEGQVHFTLEGEQYRKNITNDFVIFNIKDVSPKEYSINVYFIGNGLWEDASEILTFTVDASTPLLEVENVVHGFDVDVVVRSSGEGQVHFTLGGVEYRQNVLNGIANFNLKNIPPGDYFTQVYFEGSEFWENAEDSLTFSISRQQPAFEATSRIRGLDAEIIVKSAGQGQVRFTLDGAQYRRNINDGIVSFIIKGLPIGHYSTTVYFEGNEFWQNASQSLSFTVDKPQSSINAPGRAYSIVYGGTYAVKTNAINQKVTFTINSKQYFSTSDAKGIAKIKLTKSMLGNVGLKSITVRVSGDNYLPAVKTAKIKVKHEKTKWSVKKVYKFKNSKKTKKIKVTLKDSKNKAVKKVKVTLKIKGKKVGGKKTFTLKTNGNGMVTFNLKNSKFLKKGKYSATIRFNGDKNYNKVTQKLKFVIQ